MRGMTSLIPEGTRTSSPEIRASYLVFAIPSWTSCCWQTFPHPIENVSVNATINGYLTGLDSTLKYSNDGADPLEVVFRFPIEESFAIVGLEAIIAGRRITADLREKDEARQAYDDALASGFTEALARRGKVRRYLQHFSWEFASKIRS